MRPTARSFILLLTAAPFFSGCGSRDGEAEIDTAPVPETLLIADRQYLRGSSGQAQETARGVLETDPESFQAHYRLGFYLFFDDLDEAVVHLDKAETLAPRHPGPPFFRGFAAMYDNRFREAEPPFAHGLDLGQRRFGVTLRDTTEVLREAIEAVYARRAHRAVEAFAEASAADPDDAALAYHHAWALHALGDLDAAAEVLRGVVAEEYEVAQAHALLADCLRQMQRRSGAREAAERALELDPHLALAHFVLGELLIADNEFADGFAQLLQAVLDDPTVIRYYESLGSNLNRYQQPKPSGNVLQLMDWATGFLGRHLGWPGHRSR